MVTETADPPSKRYDLRSRKSKTAEVDMVKVSNYQDGEALVDVKEGGKEGEKKGDGYFGLGSDFFSVCVLMFLYILQGMF